VQEEAFSIWTEWEHLYPIRSASRNLLKKIGQERWLISVVHHDFKDTEGLWNFLLQK
jgi:methylenetetrahydrofolate reductase (NADPH)